MSQIPYRAPSR